MGVRQWWCGFIGHGRTFVGRCVNCGAWIGGPDSEPFRITHPRSDDPPVRVISGNLPATEEARVEFIKQECPDCLTIVKMPANKPLALPEECPSCADSRVKAQAENTDDTAVLDVAQFRQEVAALRGEVAATQAANVALRQSFNGLADKVGQLLEAVQQFDTFLKDHVREQTPA